MKLTAPEISRLKSFQRAREHPPTVGSVLWQIRTRSLVMMFVVAVLVVLVFLISPSREVSFTFLGFALGTPFFLITAATITARFWPLTRQVIDWEKINQLLKENERPAA